MAFSIDRFVADCRAVRSRPDWPQAIAELLRAAVREPEAIDALIAERGASARKGFDLWEQSDDLTIYQVEGKPGLVSPPHDHACVAVVGVYRGSEGYRNFQVVDGRLTPSGEVTVHAPDVSVLREDLIHALDNSASAGSGSIHIYGNIHFDLADRRLWNPETLEQAPYSTRQQFKWTKGAPARAEV
jgi:predicted metal-dependent enzyme (double-stranded beta helix superfamily)